MGVVIPGKKTDWGGGGIKKTTTPKISSSRAAKLHGVNSYTLLRFLCRQPLFIFFPPIVLLTDLK